MERICDSCGADPGAGAFCQHCGARLDGSGSPATPTPPAAPSAPIPAATGPTPPLIAGQTPAAKGSGCRSGCLIAGVVALVLLTVGGFLVWRYFNDEVLPGIQDAVDEVTSFSDAPPGPCYDLVTQDGLLTGWNEVPCSGPRQVEVTFAATFEEGSFPGDDYLATTAKDTCTAAFQRYVGVSPEESVYGFDWLVPTEETWAGGARQGICLVVSGDGSDLTGTVKESRT